MGCHLCRFIYGRVNLLFLQKPALTSGLCIKVDLSAMFSTYLSSAILLIICYWAFRLRNNRGVPLPPGEYCVLTSVIPIVMLTYSYSCFSLGPKPLPIIGNLHQIPRKNSVQTYKEWAAMYGKDLSINFSDQCL